MSAYWKIVWILFGLLIITHAVFLHRVPGLMGDEASEGENVYELLQREGITVTGERSYIGPMIDYIRVPFIAVFGYTPLAVRLVVIGFSFATFWLAAAVLKRFFGEVPALFGLATFFFSPVYLTQQRIAWAITLLPFFSYLLLFVLTARFRYRALVAGVVAGVGLSNHILFFPTLVGIVGAAIVYLLFFTPSVSPSHLRGRVRVGWTFLLSYWPALIGFAAGFGMQFAVLLLQREDQGDVGETTQLFGERLVDLPDVLPLVVSGSSFVARYTGVEFAPWAIWMICTVVAALVLVALIRRGTRRLVWVWMLGLMIQLVVLMYMIDRYTLRYFVAPVLGVWMLGGVGLGELLRVLSRQKPSGPAVPTSTPRSNELFRAGPLLVVLGPVFRRATRGWAAFIVACSLVLWTTFIVLIPFLRTGGSTNDFSLGNRTDSAAALVDTRGLVACLRGAGPVSSENVHIWNRLQFLSHSDQGLEVRAQEEASHARWMVEYRDERHPEPGELCPELRHFRVVAR